MKYRLGGVNGSQRYRAGIVRNLNKKLIIMNRIFTSIAALSVVAAMSAVEFAGGDGTAANPYQITTAEQLQAIKDGLTSHYLLMNDIDLDGIKWQPIGDGTNPFTGTFNGGGHIISNFTDDSGTDGYGFFGRCNDEGVIENLIMANADLVVGRWCGIVCANNGNWERQGGTIRNVEVRDSYINGSTVIAAIAGTCDGFAENCRVINTTVECDGIVAGGIAACSNGGKNGHFYDCVFHGNITGESVVSGICAQKCMQADRTVPQIKNCVVYGNITGTGAGANVAGITAEDTWWDATTNPQLIDNCCSFAAIRGGQIGGINGNGQMGITSNCYVTGDMTVTTSFNADLPWSGGISATCYNPSMSDVYFGGKITNASGSADVKVGAILGRQWDITTIKNAFYSDECGASAIGETVVNMTVENVVALLPEQMTDLANFSFSDPSRWQIVKGETMPFFANQTAPLKISEATTDRVAGTCSADLERVIVIGSISEVIYNDVEIADGKWSMEFSADDVIEGETLTVIGIDKNKMPSMAMLAKVEAGVKGGTSVTVSDKSFSIKVVANKAMFGLEAGYTVCTPAGAVVKSGVAREISLDGLGSGCYIVSATANGNTVSSKIIIR